MMNKCSLAELTVSSFRNVQKYEAEIVEIREKEVDEFELSEKQIRHINTLGEFRLKVLWCDNYS